MALPGLCPVTCEPGGLGGPVLTPRTIARSVHKGQTQPLILLQSTLVCEAAVHGAHHVSLLLAVVDSGFRHVHWLPAEADNCNGGWGPQHPVVGRKA